MRFAALVWFGCGIAFAQGDLRDCARRAAEALGADADAQVTIRTLEESTGEEQVWLQAFRAAGKRIRTKSPNVLKITLARGLQSGICAIEWERSATHQAILVEYAPVIAAQPPGLSFSIDRQLVWQQPERILDLRLDSDDHGYVLEPERLLELARKSGEWSIAQALSLEGALRASRDARGRIAAGTPMVVYASGLKCALDPAASGRLSCSPSEMPGLFEPDLALGTLEPQRNYFSDGPLNLFAAAAAFDSGKPVIAATRLSGQLDLLKPDTHASLGSIAHWGDDVVSVVPGCGGQPLLIGSANEPGRLQTYRLSRRRAEPVSAPAPLPGELTALWQMTAQRAVAITYDSTSRLYAAHLLTLTCR